MVDEQTKLQGTGFVLIGGGMDMQYAFWGEGWGK